MSAEESLMPGPEGKIPRFYEVDRGNKTESYIHAVSGNSVLQPGPSSPKKDVKYTKEEAFKSIVKVHVIHLDYVSELYDFNSEDFRSFIIHHIEFTVLRCNEFKLALDITAAFKLHNHFAYDLFVLPCYLLGHHDQAKEFLISGQCSEHQRRLVKFFDDFIDQPEDYVHERLNKFTDQRILKMSREIFLGKPLLKRVKDLIKCFDMQKEEKSLAPRMIFHCSLHDMLYNARRRFTDEVINDACYFQLLRDELKTANVELKKAFIGRLFRLGGSEYKEDAVRWMIYLGLSDHQLHQDVVEYMHNTPEAVKKADASIVACEQMEDLNELLLLDKYPVIWVKDTTGVKELIEEFAKADVIALDSEWKQKSGSLSADQIALLQLYLSEKVYLVDFISLEQYMSADEWKSFLGALLTGPSIKLGFDLLNDVRAMFAGQHTSPLKYLEDETNNVICLKNLVHNVPLDITAAFKLHNHFAYDLFVLPCYLLGHHDQAKEFLISGQCSEHQRRLVKFFDDFIDQPEDYVHERLNKFTDQRILKMSREIFLGKPLLKRVKDLIKCFDMQKEEKSLAPRMIFHCSLHDMLYNARRRFTDEVINDACYFQLLRDELKTANVELKKAFIGRLFRLGGSEYKEDAVRWMIYLGLSDHQLHQDVVEYMHNTPEAVKKADASIVACEQMEDLNELLLLDKYPVIWVKDTTGVKELIEEFAKADVIALDSEWKQKSGSLSADQIALLQLYLSEKVYLVDFISLEQYMSADEWKSFLGALLTGPSIKLGFDLLNDVRAMFAGQHTSPLKYLEDETNNVICLKNLVHNILMVDSDFITFDRKAAREDSDINLTDGEHAVIHFKLSDLSEKVAKRVLDKSEQCSNWAARPLRKAQMTYAAMDAYIVYEIYELILQKASDSQVGNSWDELLKQSIWNASRKDKVKKKNDQKLDSMDWKEMVESFSQPALEKYDSPRKPGEVKLLIDSHLKGLGKNLRRLGVDVLWPLRDGESVIRMATKLSDRTIISSATMKKVNELRSRFSNRVLYLEGANDVTLIESVKAVIKKLNIQLSAEDIFSRCMECNAAKFIKAPRPVIQALYESTVVIPNDGGDYPFDLHNWLEVLRGVDEQDYDGIGCDVQVHPEYPDLVNILCHDGSIDILKNLVMHHTDVFPVDTLVKKVPIDVIKKPSIPFYYICGGCGKVYWDGSHQASYNKHVETHDVLSQ